VFGASQYYPLSVSATHRPIPWLNTKTLKMQKQQPCFARPVGSIEADNYANPLSLLDTLRGAKELKDRDTGHG
jgi:hypothetical protein